MLNVKKTLTKILNYLNGDDTWTTLGTLGKYAKKGGWVHVYVWSGGAVVVSASGSTTVGTLPAGYRPKTDLNFPACARGTNNTSYVSVTTAGAVVFHNDTTVAQSYWFFSISFPTA
jgi:hypothetical protein